ncbi:hypothetical protein J0S82_001617, partial [Galemys pyrenaicus]
HTGHIDGKCGLFTGSPPRLCSGVLGTMMLVKFYSITACDKVEELGSGNAFHIVDGEGLLLSVNSTRMPSTLVTLARLMGCCRVNEDAQAFTLLASVAITCGLECRRLLGAWAQGTHAGWSTAGGRFTLRSMAQESMSCVTSFPYGSVTLLAYFITNYALVSVTELFASVLTYLFVLVSKLPTSGLGVEVLLLSIVYFLDRLLVHATKIGK